MLFASYLGGWALYRLWKWCGWYYGAHLKSQQVRPLDYWRRFAPLVLRDLVIQVVIGFAWLSGMLDKALVAAYTALGWTPTEIQTPITAALVGFVVASMLSEILIKHLPANGEPPALPPDAGHPHEATP